MGLFRYRLTLRSGGLLEMFERFQVVEGRLRVPKYSFHWQDADGRLRKRWDNATHHPEVATHPHHVHDGAEANVLPHGPINAEGVLATIAAEAAEYWKVIGITAGGRVPLYLSALDGKFLTGSKKFLILAFRSPGGPNSTPGSLWTFSATGTVVEGHPFEIAIQLGLMLFAYEPFELADGSRRRELAFLGSARFGEGPEASVEIVLTESKDPLIGIDRFADMMAYLRQHGVSGPSQAAEMRADVAAMLTRNDRPDIAARVLKNKEAADARF